MTSSRNSRNLPPVSAMSNAPKLHKSPSCLYLTRCERREAWPCEVKEAGMRLGGDERERGRQTKREGKKERTRKKGGKKERTQADLSERLGDIGLGAGMVQGYKSRLRLQSCVRCDSIGRSFGEAGTLRPNSRKRCRFLCTKSGLPKPQCGPAMQCRTVPSATGPPA